MSRFLFPQAEGDAHRVSLADACGQGSLLCTTFPYP